MDLVTELTLLVNNATNVIIVAAIILAILIPLKAWHAKWVQKCAVRYFAHRARQRDMRDLVSLARDFSYRHPKSPTRCGDHNQRGTVLIMVLLITMMMASAAYVAVMVGMHRSKAARFYENETICLYSAEAGVARAQHTPESFAEKFGGTNLIVNVVESGGVMTVTSTATLGESDCTVIVTLVNVPITIPQVTSLYLSDYSVINLNGSAFEIDGNNKAGIVTDGSAVELLVMIDAAYYPQITGAGGTPSIGEDTFEFNDAFSTLGLIAESTLGTALDPHVTVMSGDVHLTGNQEAYGVLLVDGNLTISGTFDFNGLVMVTGDLRVTGDMLISGSIMVSGDLEKVAGSIAIEYNEDTLNAAQGYVNGLDQLYKQVVWRKI